MKSIGIVYKRSKREFTISRIGVTDTRRSVEDRNIQIQEDNIDKQDLVQKIRNYTSRANQNKDRGRIFSSLNIQSINQSAVQAQRKKEIDPQKKKLTIKKPTSSHITIRIPQNIEQPKQENITHRLNDFGKYSKLKMHGKIHHKKSTTVIISVDFILNQENFWSSSEPIQESSVKVWKTLMPLTNIIWLIKRRDTIKKLQHFSLTHKVRFDGIVQVEPSKKQSLYVSYYPLEKQLNLEKSSKIIVVQALKIRDFKQVSDIEFKNTLPVIIHPIAFIHFIKTDMSSKQRMNFVMKVLVQDPPTPLNLKSIQEAFQMRKGNQIQALPQRIDNDEIDALQLLEEIKRKLCNEFQQRIGLTTKIEGDSVQYIIGDMLRRNFRFFEKLIKQQKRPVSPLRALRKAENISYSLSYTKPVYLWQI